jgi:hypothetical protein
VPTAQRRSNRVEGVRQCAGDRVAGEVLGACLDIAAVLLQPLVVARRDVEAEHVNRLRLAAKVRCQLLRDEHVVAIGDLERPVDRVVIGDCHEVHSATLGELVSLLRFRRTLGQPECSLHAEA